MTIRIISLGLFIISVAATCQHTFLSKPQPPGQEEVTTDFGMEQFDTVNDAAWSYSLISFTGNACQMSRQSVSVSKSVLLLTASLDTNQNQKWKYKAGGLSGSQFYLYGYFSFRMKGPSCPGTVGGVFQTNKYEPQGWEQKGIDTEFRGNTVFTVQCTTLDNFLYSNPATYSTNFEPLHFETNTDFHEYGVLWTADSISWFADGIRLTTTRKLVPQVPLQLVLLHYVGDMQEPGIRQWLGNVNDSCFPSTTSFDWIRVEQLEQYYKRTK